jgi:5-methylcytosine-specific restriction endonuclease McrA
MPRELTFNEILYGKAPIKKRKTLTSAQRIYIWERPNIYGRKCSICNRRITKLSELELDHKRAHIKGGKKLVLAHKDCNRLKSSGSLAKIQKTLGIKTKKKKIVKKRLVKQINKHEFDPFDSGFE